MWLVLGMPRLFGDHSLSQDMGLLLLPQLGPGTEQALAAGQWCAPGARHCTALHCRWQRGRVCHTLVIGGSQLVRMGTRTMHRRMSPVIHIPV